MVKLTAFASALALASLAAPPFANATDKMMRPCIECIPGGGGGGDAGPDVQNGQDQNFPGRLRKFPQPDIQNEQGQGPDQFQPRRRVKKFEPNDQFQQGGGDLNAPIEKRAGKSKQAWKYDSSKHERRRYKDKKFRFYFSGFWYPYPYWDDPYYYDDYYIEPYRVSCREGAEIVSERFSRVRILECNGRVYTYVGRRYGDTFEIKLSSRTGRILEAREI
jgi:hypothetical protein